jgi:chemotaxis-related protein WspB
MLFLLFQAGNDAYALEAQRVREVIPRVLLRECPGAPAFVAGLFNYRGVVVPVLDFCRLLQRPPCRPRLSTRILLMTGGEAAPHCSRLLGLMVESLIKTMEAEEQVFSQAGVAAGQAPFLGAIFCDGERLIQRLIPDRLLSAETAALLLAGENPGK